jgi:hypothetical protein
MKPTTRLCLEGEKTPYALDGTCIGIRIEEFNELYSG